MKFKNTFILSFLIIVSFSACSFNQKNISENQKQIVKEKPFEYKRPEISARLLTSIANIVRAIANHDIKLINEKYIHPTFGFYNLSKIEGERNFLFQKKIYNVLKSNNEEFSQLIKRVKRKVGKQIINFKDINFNCSPNDDAFYGWDDYGVFFIDKSNNYLSSLMNKANKIEKNIYKDEDFHKAKIIEKMSYKVVITPEIVFYVSKIDENWYITLIDRITTDCSS